MHDQLSTSSTRRRRGINEAGHGALLRPVAFDLGWTQWQFARSSGPVQLQAYRSIGLDQLATSSTRRRRGHGEAWHGAFLRPIVFDLGSTQQKVVLGSAPEHLQSGRSIGFDQLATPTKTGASALIICHRHFRRGLRFLARVLVRKTKLDLT